MFTENDLREYCSDILNMENRMAAAYKDLSVRLSHTRHSGTFQRLAEEERLHAAKAQRLMDILGGPGRGSEPEEL